MVYFEFRIAVFTEMCLLSFKYFCNSWKNCWRITYCLQRGILSFQCALVMNNFVNKQTCDLFWNNIAKTLFYKTKVFIAVNVRFENWQISVETYPHILHFFFFKYLMIYNRWCFKVSVEPQESSPGKFCPLYSCVRNGALSLASGGPIIVQWNLDLMKRQRTGEIVSLYRKPRLNKFTNLE